MISVGACHGAACARVSLNVRGMGSREPKEGRQGKSAASGRAHKVGWLEFQRPLTHCDSRRFPPKAERNQCPNRRRRQAAPLSGP